MFYKDAKKLKQGSRVEIWAGSPSACGGTVVRTSYDAVKIKWDDGQTGIIHIRDLKNVSNLRCEGERSG